MIKAGALLTGLTAAAVLALAATVGPAQALTVMQQCGQQYQAAKAANTLNGMNWNQFRTDCAAKLKAQPVSAPAPEVAPAVQPAVVPPANTPKAAPAATTAAAPAAPPPVVLAPAPATSAVAPTTPAGAAKPASPGRTAMLTRERQCGAEWRSQKATLVAQTPGLTWPKYWSQCNTRLKAAGQ